MKPIWSSMRRASHHRHWYDALRRRETTKLRKHPRKILIDSRSRTAQGCGKTDMTATAEMIIEDVPFASPPGPPPPPDELAAREGPVALHGRLLNVSRMATIGEMAAGVAHELNQPLTAIANYAHACERLLSRPQADGADVREALRQITVQTTRAAEILRRLRALAPT